uniref:Envelope glycoprotein n=1 Tax=Globodera pallida TaxID=36090 RepID=A0A183CSE6_GLOPA
CTCRPFTHIALCSGTTTESPLNGWSIVSDRCKMKAATKRMLPAVFDAAEDKARCSRGQGAREVIA